jgi:hypothetical protein
MVRRGLVRVLKRIIRVLRSVVVDCTIDFFKEFTSSFAKDVMNLSPEQKAQVRAKIADRSNVPHLEQPIRNSVFAGTAAVVTCLVTKTLQDPIVRRIEKSMAMLLPMPEGTLQKRMAAFITKELYTTFSTEAFNTIFTAVSHSLAEAWDDKGFHAEKFEKALLGKLKDKLDGLITDKVKSWAESLADDLARVPA